MTLTGRSGPLVDPGAGAEVLAPFVGAGVFDAYEVQFVATVLRLRPGLSDLEVLALAVAARAPRFGHVCSVLDDLSVLTGPPDEGETADPLPWPAAGPWVRALEASAVVADPARARTGPLRPLVIDDGRLYLQRYWHYELAVADSLIRRSPSERRPGEQAEGGEAEGGEPVGTPGPATSALLGSLFGPDTPGPSDPQRVAVERGLRPGVSIVAGGPGTGKTYTVARLLAASHLAARAAGRELRVALAAPTGKAAARMGEAVKAAVSVLGEDGTIDPEVAGSLATNDPTTVHSLLGWRPGTRFRHDADHPLPHDMVIVDETSMVSLPLMAKLLDAVRPDARLVLVGDPYQLTSIEVGTVMSDLVGPAGDEGTVGHPSAVLAGRVTLLSKVRRFDEDSAIAALADAVRTGDADGAVALMSGMPAGLRWVRPDDPARVADIGDEVAAVGVEMVAAARAGDAAGALAASERVKVLAATRRGPFGLDDWTRRLQESVADAIPGLGRLRRWYVGRPVLVTANDPHNRVFNGDTGVVVEQDGGMAVAFRDGGSVRYLAPTRLQSEESWWAMTIHKSQGSEFDHAVVSLPRAASPILTRQLLYTAVTRAKDRLTVIGSEESVRAAIDRPVARASGLEERLWPRTGPDRT